MDTINGFMTIVNFSSVEAQSMVGTGCACYRFITLWMGYQEKSSLFYSKCSESPFCSPLGIAVVVIGCVH